MAKGLRQLKVIVAVAGAKPMLSTTATIATDDLAQIDTATASLLPGPDGLPTLLIVQLSQAPTVEAEPQESSSPPHRLTLTTEDGRVLTTEDGVPLVLPDAP